jgi:hypothetical protein
MRAGRRKHLREIALYAESLGVEDVEVQQHGRHPCLTGTMPDGRAIRYTLAGSPGDSARGGRNAEAALRRLVRRPQ